MNFTATRKTSRTGSGPSVWWDVLIEGDKAERVFETPRGLVCHCSWQRFLADVHDCRHISAVHDAIAEDAG
ncbi:MAG: hypothetical protein N2C14_30760 [Planctomycetales bacterium]